MKPIALVLVLALGGCASAGFGLADAVAGFQIGDAAFGMADSVADMTGIRLKRPDPVPVCWFLPDPADLPRAIPRQ